MNYPHRNNPSTETAAIRQVLGPCRPFLFQDNEKNDSDLDLATTIRLVPIERSVESRVAIVFRVTEREPGEVRRPFSPGENTSQPRSVRNSTPKI